MKINVEAFPQSFRYGKYISFATLVIPITVLGLSNLHFPAKPFFAKLQLMKVWAWAETKSVFVDAEWQQKHLTSFKQIGSLIEKHKTKTSLLSCRPHDKSDVFVLCFLYRRSSLFETRQVGVVQHHKSNKTLCQRC